MIKNTFIILDGVGDKKESLIWQQDIKTWDEFIQKEKVPRISEKTKTIHDAELQVAKENLNERNSRYFSRRLKTRDHWRLFEDFEKICYLDIETTGFDADRSDLTVVGLYDGENVKTYIKGFNLEEKALKDELSKYHLIVTFFGSAFDVPFIKRKFPTIDFDMPHFDLCFAGRRIGLSGGLKHIEKVVGIKRDEEVVGIDGYEAVRLWKRWIKNNDTEALRTLTKYNQEDILNLKPLADMIYKRLKEATFKNRIY
ncbi:MAG: ribonuclease H-like domain-containing protein [Candidatus Hydrothermarchaeales archaeon]